MSRRDATQGRPSWLRAEFGENLVRLRAAVGRRAIRLHGEVMRRDRAGSSRPDGVCGRDGGEARRDRGSATVEMALALPVVALLLAFGIGAVVAVTYKLGCVARARDTALAAARGIDVPLPGGGPRQRESVEYGNDGTVTATVEIAIVSCTATAVMEP